MNTAQYKAFQRNGMRYWKIRYTQTLAAAPKVTGYPRWFLVAATDKGAEPGRNEVVAYVPPKGKGRIPVIGNRWSPLSVSGR